jgi:ribosomal protein L37E
LKSLDRDEVAQKLSEKGATKPCHRCGQNSFTVLEGYTNIQLQDDFKTGLVIGGPSVPVTHIACNNCGAITSHALGALDMLPKEEVPDGK